MPNQQPNLEKKPKFNLRYILIVLILVILVGGGILAYQYWWLPKQEVKQTELTPADETTNWKTVNHPFYHFQIKVPPDWWETEYRSPGVISFHETRFRGDFLGSSLALCPPYYETCSSGIAPGGPVELFAPILFLIIECEGCETKDAFEFHYSEMIWRPNLEDAVKRVDLSTELSRYWLERGATSRAELILFDSAYEAVFDNMLSSFKLLEQLYKNERFGYSFYLPKTWVHIAQDGKSGYTHEIFIEESDLETLGDDPLISQNPLAVILSRKVGGLMLERFARVGSYKDFNLDDLKSYLSQPAGGPNGEYAVSLKSFNETINNNGIKIYFYTAEVQSEPPVLRYGAAWITPRAVYKLEALVGTSSLIKILDRAAISFKEIEDLDETAN